VGNGRLLLELEGLRLELGGLLHGCQLSAQRNTPISNRICVVPWKPRTGSW
jgi:hypothetical protein